MLDDAREQRRRDRAAASTAAGLYLAPALVTDVTPEMELFGEEVFGPVLTASAFDSDRDAIALANATPYGLVAGVWTRDLSRAHRVAAGIRAGQIFVNTLRRGRRRRAAVRRHEALRDRPREGHRGAAGLLAGQERLHCPLDRS